MPTEKTGGRHVWLIDGFNLYHAICSLERKSGSRGLRWLNPLALARPHVPEEQVLEAWHFTATPHHLKAIDPPALHAHMAYQRALTALRPRINLVTGVFSQEKVVRRDKEGRTARWSEWREKGTDVALALKAVSLAADATVSDITVVSGDSDFVPLAQLFGETIPDTRLRFAFPPGRFSRQLAELAPGSFALAKEAIANARMEDAVRLPSGKSVVCPDAWR